MLKLATRNPMWNYVVQITITFCFDFHNLILQYVFKSMCYFGWNFITWQLFLQKIKKKWKFYDVRNFLQLNFLILTTSKPKCFLGHQIIVTFCRKCMSHLGKSPFNCNYNGEWLPLDLFEGIGKQTWFEFPPRQNNLI